MAPRTNVNCVVDASVRTRSTPVSRARLSQSIERASDEWLGVQGNYVYVCDNGAGRLRRVLSLATGSILRRTAGISAPSCPTLLYAQSAT